MMDYPSRASIFMPRCRFHAARELTSAEAGSAIQHQQIKQKGYREKRDVVWTGQEFVKGQAHRAGQATKMNRLVLPRASSSRPVDHDDRCTGGVP